jgi:putative colanic acid biosynthesis glycosyltransferase
MPNSFAAVTVCLNDRSGLAETYCSLRNQTKSVDQWVVIDGASEDGTQTWLEDVNWEPLQWSSVEDEGIYDAMNKGLHAVKTDYVFFLNSGDSLCGHSVLESVAIGIASRDTRPTLLYGDCYVVEANGSSFLRKGRSPSWVPIGMPTSHQAMFFTTSAITTGFDLRFGLSSDYAMLCKLFMANRGRDFAQMAEPLCSFRLGGRSETGRRQALQEDHQIRREILGMSELQSGLLYWAHFTHHILKRKLPFVQRLFRYE